MQNIVVSPDGRVQFVYADELLPLCDLGTATVRRAGFVEPHAAGGWIVDLSPVGGRSQAAWFQRREDALAFERAHVEEELLLT